jgi:hypothetical protein
MGIHQIILDSAAAVNVTVDPRHVEAWMRADHDTLGHLDAQVFEQYCIQTANADLFFCIELERMAQAEEKMWKA